MKRHGCSAAVEPVHSPGMDARIEELAARLGLTGPERKTAVIERALSALEDHAGRQRPDRAQVARALDRYIAAGPGLRKRLTAGGDGALSSVLRRSLYDERGLPR